MGPALSYLASSETALLVHLMQILSLGVIESSTPNPCQQGTRGRTLG